MHRSILSIGIAAILVLGTFLAYNFAVAQEDHDHAEHAAEIAGEEGASYTVTVADFGDRTFDHWDDDSTNNTREITLEEDTTITAYYEVGAEAEADTDGSNRLLDRLAKKGHSPNAT
jgi:hypothetical protein